MTLKRMYEGPTSVELDEYETPAPTFAHGAFVRVGAIRRVSPDGLSAEVWECRLPARFNKAVVVRPGGLAVGTFATGSGDAPAVLLIDICRALSTGFARIACVEDGLPPADVNDQVLISEPGQPVAVLSSADSTLLARTQSAVSTGMLSFEPAGG